VINLKSGEQRHLIMGNVDNFLENLENI
jgi:hypothetical protein